MLIGPFVEELAQDRRALVVIDEGGRFVGMVTGRSVLKALAADPSSAERAKEFGDRPAVAAAPGQAAGPAMR
jgi:CBS domain-containing protein